jgi:hypothetical protein
MYIILVFKVFVPISLGPWAVPDGPQGPSASQSDPLYGDENVPFYPYIKTARTAELCPRRAGRTPLKSSSKVLVLWSIETEARPSAHFLPNTNIYSSLSNPLSKSHLPSPKHSNSPTSPSSWPSLLNSRGRGACA